MNNTRPQIKFSDEQDMLLDVAIKFARDKSPIEIVRKKIDAHQSFNPELWREITELGWPAITIDEKFGGSGLSLAETVAVSEPMGRALFASPLPSAWIAAEIVKQAGSQTQQETFLKRISQGQQAAIALTEPHGDWALDNIQCTASPQGDQISLSGTKTFITDALTADMLIASVNLDRAPRLVILDKNAIDQIAFEPETIIDETRLSFRAKLDGVKLSKDNFLQAQPAQTVLHHAHLVACLLLAAEMCGGTAATLDVVVDYLKTRKQFDRYIGAYQALKHPTVDILIGLDAARSLLYYAACLPLGDQQSEIAIRMAKAQACDAFAFAADRAIQFHGGFGFTYDCDAQLFRRRALWCEYQHGDSAYHRRKLADLLF